MLIVGAKGFAKELLSIIENYDDLVFYDDVSSDSPELLFDRFPILKNESAAAEYFNNVNKDFVIGVGNPYARSTLKSKFSRLGGKICSLVSTSAKIGLFGNHIGVGTTILTNVVIETNNAIGECCLLHNNAFISHDVTLGDFNEISPSVNILGNVKIGNFCRIGANATVLPNVTIGNNVTVGAGAVVTRDVPSDCTVVGVPAREINKKK